MEIIANVLFHTGANFGIFSDLLRFVNTIQSACNFRQLIFQVVHGK